jgi:hypothetical protein
VPLGFVKSARRNPGLSPEFLETHMHEQLEDGARARQRKAPHEIAGNGPTMNPLYWTRDHRFAFLATTICGACLGVVAGVRPFDPGVNQNLYWLWLGAWVASGALLAAVGAYIRELLRDG